MINGAISMAIYTIEDLPLMEKIVLDCTLGRLSTTTFGQLQIDDC